VVASPSAFFLMAVRSLFAKAAFLSACESFPLLPGPKPGENSADAADSFFAIPRKVSNRVVVPEPLSHHMRQRPWLARILLCLAVGEFCHRARADLKNMGTDI
jgi:hypothetical protein